MLGLLGDLEICCGRRRERVRRTQSGGSPPRACPCRFACLQLFLSPDGQWLAVPLVDGATCNVWALPTAGGPMKPLTDFGDRSNVIARSVSWSADGQSLFAAVAETETDIVLFDGLIR